MRRPTNTPGFMAYLDLVYEKEFGMTSLQETDREAAAVAVAPRVSLADIEAAIDYRYDFTADKVTDEPFAPSLKLLSICILVMQNGFTIIGKSAPASAANFNAEASPGRP